MSTSLTLDYLDFEHSEDEQGVGTFDAMASTWPAHTAAVRAEIASVLDWAHANFPGVQAPLDEGGEWDFQLQAQQEWSAPESLAYHPHTRQFTASLGPAGPIRHTTTLSISGTPQFCAAFRQRFALD